MSTGEGILVLGLAAVVDRAPERGENQGKHIAGGTAPVNTEEEIPMTEVDLVSVQIIVASFVVRLTHNYALHSSIEVRIHAMRLATLDDVPSGL